MCQRIVCPSCGKPTWTGCSRHIEQVLAGVPLDQRCQCREQAAAKPAGQAARIPIARPNWSPLPPWYQPQRFRR